MTNTLNIFQLIDAGIDKYHILKNGDHILAAISGGKDSITMLHALNEIKKRGQIQFKLTAINIKTDFHCGACTHQEKLKEIFDKWDVPYVFKNIVVLDEKKQTNCFWCSWCRRKCLFETARELGCNKIALGHHKDDIVETILLNLFFKGEISTMTPNQEMFGGDISIIRPLCMVEESIIISFAKENNFTHKVCKCPFGATSQRKVMKNIVNEFSAKFPELDIRKNIFQSLSNLKEINQ
ncbi:MAG: hypothetical protein HQL25_01700 [Candidatus Omnitrophica bacterium]|nr:hypothetical protein [Candidatus Omnitrophota bacterium]